MDAYEVINALLSSDEQTIGKYINTLADEFRRGGDLRQLRPLLTHPDARFVSVAAWIVAEVADSTRGREIYPELCSLLSHDDPEVRFEVIKSVTFLVRPNEKNIIRLLLQRLVDENPGVRRQALFHVCMLPDTVLEGMRETSDWQCVRILIDGVTMEQIRSTITSNDLFEQRLAVASAMRNYGNDVAFIEELTPMFDDEVMEEIETLPRQRSFV